MPWVRVSDDFMDHDRFEDLSLDARRPAVDTATGEVIEEQA